MLAKSDRVKKEITALKKKLRSKDLCAANNLAVIYRKLGNRKRAFFWWKQATKIWDDGDSFLEIAYCYQYGLGVCVNQKNAIHFYWRAIASNYISQYGREEAKYHLAIAFLDVGKDHFFLKKSMTLLEEAVADEDFPQARILIQHLTRNEFTQFCRCRRGLLRSLGGKSQCQVHGPRKRRLISKHK